MQINIFLRIEQNTNMSFYILINENLFLYPLFFLSNSFCDYHFTIFSEKNEFPVFIFKK
jgi:hypothetical protein